MFFRERETFFLMNRIFAICPTFGPFASAGTRLLSEFNEIFCPLNFFRRHHILLFGKSKAGLLIFRLFAIIAAFRPATAAGTDFSHHFFRAFQFLFWNKIMFFGKSKAGLLIFRLFAIIAAFFLVPTSARAALRDEPRSIGVFLAYQS